MAKKVRRVRPQQRPERGPVLGEPEPARPAPIAAPNRAAPRRASKEELAEEYAYVLRDLRRIFLLAAAMFALLILLNLLF
jgi:hypothetical protein